MIFQDARRRTVLQHSETARLPKVSISVPLITWTDLEEGRKRTGRFSIIPYPRYRLNTKVRRAAVQIALGIFLRTKHKKIGISRTGLLNRKESAAALTKSDKKPIRS